MTHRLRREDPHGDTDPSYHHGYSHSLPDGVAPLFRAGTLALATTGELLPSPAAFVVLAGALATGQGGYGLALVAAFILGMAATH